MAVIVVSCPQCSTRYKIDEAHCGKKAKCKKCGASFEIGATLAGLPVASASTPSPAAPSSKGTATAKERPRGEDGILRDWAPGDVILDLYEVKAILGKGGMGQVDRVWHRQWRKDLAVKSVLPERALSAIAIENFKTEAEQWVDKIGLHPNVVACHYVRLLGGVPRVFIEYVDGGTLQEWIT